VPDGDYVAVLEQHLPSGDPALSPGPIVNTAGERIGEHAGYARYTVGQRRRLLGGSPEALYVVAIVPTERAVVVGTAADLLSDRVELEEINWLADPLAEGDTCEVQVRHRARAVTARVLHGPDGRFVVQLAEPVRAVTPGQSGVLYDGTRLLGGGVIS